MWYANLLGSWANQAVSAARGTDLANAISKLDRVRDFYERGLFPWSDSTNTITLRVGASAIEVSQAPASLSFAQGIRKFLLVEMEDATGSFSVEATGTGFQTSAWSSKGVGAVKRQHAFALYCGQTGATTLNLSIDAGGFQKTVAIPAQCDAPANLTIRLSDTLDPTFPCARVAVKASDGYNYVPEPYSRTYFWGPEFFAYVNDKITYEIPPGETEILVEKGFHYRQHLETVTLAAGESRTVDVALEPIFDIYAESWYPGETHLHFGPENRLNDGFVADTEMPVIASGEGLSVLQIHPLQTGNNIHSDYLPVGRLTSAETARIKIDIGEEFRNDPAGHLLFMNISSLVTPVTTGSGGSQIFDDWPTNTDQAIAARAQGGLVSSAHGGNSTEVPSLKANNVLDAINVGDLSITLGSYDNYLEAGLRMPLTAGPDFVIVNGPRLYAYVSGEFTYAKWIDAIRAGRAFATQGPLVFLRVDGNLPGDTLEFEGAKTVRVVARSISRQTYDRLEIVYNGQTVATALPGAGNDYEATIDQNLLLDESGWLSARTFQSSGQPSNRNGNDGEIRPVYMQRAATSPVYILKDGKRRSTAAAESFFDGRIRSLENFWLNTAQFPDAAAKAHAEEQLQATKDFFVELFNPKSAAKKSAWTQNQ